MRILPLGGLGEIGKNMALVEREGRIVVVDTGLMFPSAEMLGIDLVLPDFSYLRERAGDIEAIVLTHGHEDHVGALPYVLREIGYPPVIYGGMLTIGIVRSKLDEHKLRDAPLEELAAGRRVRLGPFELELIHLSHSIPDACGVLLTTELGSVLLTGDYKFDQTPVDGRPADVSRLAELGREGLLLLCGDSTNADRPGFSTSESVVGPNLERVFHHCKGRIVVTCFASNIHRVQQVVDAAAQLGRKVALRAGDTVVFPAPPIPGNERAVNETIDRLYHVGADVVTTRDAPIHASGHGFEEELKLMLNLTHPRHVMPVHGDYKRMLLHGKLAEAVGVDPDNIFRIENGRSLEIDAGGARLGERVQSGMIFVDGVDIGDVTDVALRDRRMLSADGIFIVVATISEQDGSSVAEPEIIFRGVPFPDEAEALLGDIRECVERSLA